MTENELKLDHVEDSLRTLHAALRQLNRLMLEMLVETLETGLDPMFAVYDEQAKEIVTQIKSLELERDELLPNAEIITLLGVDFHDAYKRRHPINHQTRLLEWRDKSASRIMYVAPPAPNYAAMPIARDGAVPYIQSDVRAAEWEYWTSPDGRRLQIAFAPRVNRLFWMVV